MIDAASAELGTDFVSSREAKVSDGDSQTTVEAKNVFRFEIAMIDAEVMAILDRIEYLEKNVPYEVVIGEIPALVEYLSKQITVFGEIHDNIGIWTLLENTMQSDNVGVLGGELVKENLAHVKLPLPRVRMRLGVGEAFDSVRAGRAVLGLDGPVNDPVTSDPENLSQF
jgi:hypothetical protein